MENKEYILIDVDFAKQLIAYLGTLPAEHAAAFYIVLKNVKPQKIVFQTNYEETPAPSIEETTSTTNLTEETKESKKTK